jgi:hypothetical protein
MEHYAVFFSKAFCDELVWQNECFSQEKIIPSFIGVHLRDLDSKLITEFRKKMLAKTY